MKFFRIYLFIVSCTCRQGQENSIQEGTWNRPLSWSMKEKHHLRSYSNSIINYFPFNSGSHLEQASMNEKHHLRSDSNSIINYFPVGQGKIGIGHKRDIYNNELRSRVTRNR
jgi:hypothetical protein